MFKLEQLFSKEILLYLIFGVLTTLVNIVAYIFLVKFLNINYLLGNVIAWILSVVFAYFTNRKWVFESTNKNLLNEFVLFVGGRLFSGILDSGLMFIAIDVFVFGDLISKIVINIIVVIVNYLFSKIWVFKKQ